MEGDQAGRQADMVWYVGTYVAQQQGLVIHPHHRRAWFPSCGRGAKKGFGSFLCYLERYISF